MARPKLIKQKKPLKKSNIDWGFYGCVIVFVLILIAIILFSAKVEMEWEEMGSNLCSKNDLQFENNHKPSRSFCYETQDGLILKYPIEKIDDKYYMVVER